MGGLPFTTPVMLMLAPVKPVEHQRRHGQKVAVEEKGMEGQVVAEGEVVEARVAEIAVAMPPRPLDLERLVSTTAALPRMASCD